MSTEMEPRPIPPTIEPARPRALASSDILRRMATDLTPFQSVMVARKIARGRMKAIVEHAGIENDTSLAEARVISRTKVQSTTEQAERLLHAERMECLEDVAIRHEEASRMIDLVKDEVAHTIFKDALRDASARYVSGVVRRSGN